MQRWSAIVHVPHTQVTVEVLSGSVPRSASVRWHADPMQRLPHALLKGKKPKAGIWLPVAVSRATSDLDKLRGFSTDVVSASIS